MNIEQFLKCKFKYQTLLITSAQNDMFYNACKTFRKDEPGNNHLVIEITINLYS